MHGYTPYILFVPFDTKQFQSLFQNKFRLINMSIILELPTIPFCVYDSLTKDTAYFLIIHSII